jgi:phage gp45-like
MRTLRPWALSLLLTGCASVGPRFPQQVAATFARDDMRKLETTQADIYYPAQEAAAARRVAARMNECLAALRSRPVTRTDRGKALIYLTSANFDNAYVTGYSPSGEPLHALIPLHLTLEFFHWLNLGAADSGDVACHELVHFTQFEQDDGFWGAVNWFFGNVVPQQGAIDSWFAEGLAQYYEGRLGRAVGRPNSAFYRGAFEAFVAARGGDLRASDLNPLQRELALFGGNYLTGLHFVEYLVRTYGEEKLWELVDRQGHSLFLTPPLVGAGVTVRFKLVYGKSIGALFDDYRDELVSKLAVRHRPDSQRVLDPSLGYLARLAGSPADGAMATVSAGGDKAAQLAVHEHDGSLRFARPLAQFAPGRPWVYASPDQVSGLSFTADGRWLFLMNDDLAMDGADEAQLWKVDAHSGEVVKVWEGFRGYGGSVSPDGSRYVFVQLSGDSANLVEFDVATGQRRPLTDFTGTTTVAAPAYAPDGARIAFARYGNHGFDLFLRGADGKVSRLTFDEAFNYAPQWLDEGRLLFAREREGHVQAHTLDLATLAVTPVSNAPYIVLDPVPIGGGDFAFVNRDGWNWSLDAAPVAPAGPAVLPEPQLADAPLPELAPAPPLPVLSDEAYSSLDHLFVPSLHAPTALFLPTLDTSGVEPVLGLSQQYSLSLRGQDRLGFHQWALNGQLTLPTKDSSFGFGYGNQLLAPWFSQLLLQRDQVGGDTTWSGSVDFFRTFWATGLDLSVTALDLTRAATDTEPGRHARLLGAGVAFDYLASERTLYGGTKRALGLAGGVTVYPALLSTEFGLADIQAQVVLAPRLPLLERHSLVATVRGRALYGAPAGLLQVGGVASGTALATYQPRSNGSSPDLLALRGVSFVEPLRGYEDYTVRATSAAIATARYRYPFIIDRGTASTLYLLGQFMLRQIDLEAFGSAAFTDNAAAATLTAAGGAIFFRTAVAQLPISVYYQVSARFSQNLAPLHLVGFALE